ncbi:MAG TPA: hypothetical protein PKC18_10895, partial [Lacipirellulaceae bacterium]|nr:hypothetical protein [Lacipirellulaceae bacterium]
MIPQQPSGLTGCRAARITGAGGTSAAHGAPEPRPRAADRWWGKAQPVHAMLRRRAAGRRGLPPRPAPPGGGPPLACPRLELDGPPRRATGPLEEPQWEHEPALVAVDDARVMLLHTL